jgi:hypothetical protein
LPSAKLNLTFGVQSRAETFVHPKKSLEMSKKEYKEKDFDTVKFLRGVKEKIAKDTKDMNFIELKEYINNRKLRLVK